MSRDSVMGLMKSLKFVAIPKAYDEVLATARKRKQTTETVIEQLFEIEVSERQARSIRYRMTQARFPASKDLDSFEFDKLSVEETQIKSLYGGDFIEEHRNIVFVGGTGTGKTHLATAIASQAVRSGYRAKFFSLVDLANQLEQEKLNGKGGRLADRLAKYTELVVLDELGYLPFSKNGGQLVFHLLSHLVSTHLGHHHHQPGVRRMASGLWRQENDDRTAGSSNTSLRHHRNRQRQLENQAQRLMQ